MKTLEYAETLETKNYGKWWIKLEEYTEYDNESEEDRAIYNVSIEFVIDEYASQTIDLYEDYDLVKVSKYYNDLVKNIEKVNGVRC